MEERVARLERRVYGLIGLSSFLVVALAVALMTGADKPPRTVEADRFVVKDKSGRERISIGMTPTGKALIVVYDEHGKIAQRVPADPSDVPAELKAGKFVFVDDNGKARGFMGLLDHDTFEAVVNDRRGDPRWRLSVEDGGDTTMLLLSHPHRAGMSSLVRRDGTSGLYIKKTDADVPSITLGLAGDASGLLVTDPKGIQHAFGAE